MVTRDYLDGKLIELEWKETKNKQNMTSDNQLARDASRNVVDSDKDSLAINPTKMQARSSSSSSSSETGQSNNQLDDNNVNDDGPSDSKKARSGVPLNYTKVISNDLITICTRWTKSLSIHSRWIESNGGIEQNSGINCAKEKGTLEAWITAGFSSWI